MEVQLQAFLILALNKWPHGIPLGQQLLLRFGKEGGWARGPIWIFAPGGLVTKLQISTRLQDTSNTRHPMHLPDGVGKVSLHWDWMAVKVPSSASAPHWNKKQRNIFVKTSTLDTQYGKDHPHCHTGLTTHDSKRHANCEQQSYVTSRS